MVIGRDTTIGVGVQLYGSTVIGEGARIEGPTSITDSSLESGVFIRSFSVLEGAHVSEGSGAGPFARLREGTDIAPHSYIGNFVETKNTKIGSNSLACHLTYLGDTVVCLKSGFLCTWQLRDPGAEDDMKGDLHLLHTLRISEIISLD